VNAQFPITTTPKYNFPLPEENLQLPLDFIEISMRSLKHMKSTKLTHEYQTPSYQLQRKQSTLDPTTEFTKLKPDTTKIPIVAIDVSSIRLGETEKGILIALRGAIVWKQESRYRYLRLGPFPFHITNKTQVEISSLFRQHRHTIRLQRHTIPNILYLQTKLTTLLERWIQSSINHTTRRSLILWDGSLTAGTPETPTRDMEQLLEKARIRKNTILAFSKMTRLLFNGHRLTNLLSGHEPPCIMRIEDSTIYEGPMHLMGNIYVAKLTRGSCTFRLDIDKQIPHLHAVESVQKLLGNDVVSQSYPEALRLAHIFSTFTAIEVLGVQRCLFKEKKLKIITQPNVRRILFGPFGKGLEG
jgi:hypothetical protein